MAPSQTCARGVSDKYPNHESFTKSRRGARAVVGTPADSLADLRVVLNAELVLSYLRSMTVPRFILWCYLLWWGGVVLPYFDPNPRLWLSSLGIALIIGTGLLLSTAYAGPKKTQLSRWVIARLYMMPFFVSSFAALIKGRGFILVFHPNWQGNALPLLGCLSLGAVVLGARALGTSLKHNRRHA